MFLQTLAACATMMVRTGCIALISLVILCIWASVPLSFPFLDEAEKRSNLGALVVSQPPMAFIVAKN